MKKKKLLHLTKHAEATSSLGNPQSQNIWKLGQYYRVLLYTYALFLFFHRLIAVVGDRMLGWIDLFSYKYSHSYVHNCMLPYNSEK